MIDREKVLEAERILLACQMFYDAHQEFIEELQRAGIMQEGGLYRENLPLLLTAIAEVNKRDKLVWVPR